MSKVIVDTSAWIESFRPSGDGGLKEEVRRLVSTGEVLLPGIIRVELLRGARTAGEYEMLEEVLRGLTPLRVEDDFWDRLASFSFGLLRMGITVPLTDTYISLLAIESDVSLLHNDSHFGLIAGRTKLKVL